MRRHRRWCVIGLPLGSPLVAVRAIEGGHTVRSVAIGTVGTEGGHCEGVGAGCWYRMLEGTGVFAKRIKIQRTIRYPEEKQTERARRSAEE